MSCLAKISNAIDYDCANGFVGFSKVAAINKADVTDFTIVDGQATILTRAAGTACVRVASQKRAFTAVESARVNDNAPNAYSHEVTITVFEKENPMLFNQLINGNIVVVAKYRDYYRIFGLYYGMRVTASTMNSSENGGWATFTLATPEGVLGEDYLTIDKTLGDEIISSAESAV